MDQKVLMAIGKALLHFTGSTHPFEQLYEFLELTATRVDPKIVYIATIYFYKCVNMWTNVNVLREPKLLWIGCLLTSIKQNSQVRLQFEDWANLCEIATYEMSVATRQIHALLGHNVIIHENEVDEFVKVFSNMVR